MPTNRMDRVNNQMLREISSIVKQMADKRISESYLTLTYCETSPDLKSARIGVSMVLDGNKKDVVALLNKTKGYIKKQLASHIEMRSIPDLLFVEDNTEEDALKLDALFNKIKKEN